MQTIELKKDQILQNANGDIIQILDVNGKKEFGGWKGQVWYKKIDKVGHVTHHRQSIITFKQTVIGYEEVIQEVLDARLAEIAEVEAYEASQL